MYYLLIIILSLFFFQEFFVFFFLPLSKMASDQTPVKRRAKVYKLEKVDGDTSGWCDKGTGHASCDFDEVLDVFCYHLEWNS